MSLEDWHKNGWLKPHRTSRDEIGNLFAIVRRDLQDCAKAHVSEDWRFAIAYNAARISCTIALYCCDWQPDRGGGEHYRVIQSLTLTMGETYAEMRDYLDACRNKRNISDYDHAGNISEHEVEELIGAANELYDDVNRWARIHFPQYF